VAIVSTTPSRPCGIASYSASLARALRAGQGGDLAIGWVPVVFPGDVPAVAPELARLPAACLDVATSERAATQLNAASPDVISIQHEFGLFGLWGDPYYDGLLPFVRMLTAPSVITFHTVLPGPSESLRSVVGALCAECEEVVVPCRAAVDILATDYGVSAAKLTVLPHGTVLPDVGRMRPRPNHDCAVAPHIVTFGLMGHGKGIEIVIRAMQWIVRDWPNATCTVAGRTHPSMQEAESAAYWRRLRGLTAATGLTRNVRFLDRFLTDDELDRLLAKADVVVTPNPDHRQASSGTLARALGAGKPVVTNAHAHARDVAGAGAAVALPNLTGESVAHAVRDLLLDEARRAALGAAARQYASKTTWQHVAEQMHGVLRLAADSTPI
jgi:polysaccharide biosynthesis protein PslF